MKDFKVDIVVLVNHLKIKKRNQRESPGVKSLISGFESLLVFTTVTWIYNIISGMILSSTNGFGKKFGSTIWEFILVEIISDVKIMQRSKLKTKITRAKHLFVKKTIGFSAKHKLSRSLTVKLRIRVFVKLSRLFYILPVSTGS